MNNEMNELIWLVTRSLNIHLNVEQHFTVDSLTVLMSLERLTSESLSNKQIPTGVNAFLRLHPMSPQNFTSILNHFLSHRLFNLHLEVHPLSVNLSYLMISRFDRSPILNHDKRERAFLLTRKLFVEWSMRNSSVLHIIYQGYTRSYLHTIVNGETSACGGSLEWKDPSSFEW